DKPIGRAFGLDLPARFSEGERLGLCKYALQQDIVMPAEFVERLFEGYEVTGNEPSTLMTPLIASVLAIGSRLDPIDRTGTMVQRRPGERPLLGVALHRQLLETGRKALEILVVGQYRDRLCAEEVVVPDAEQTHEHR